MKKQKVLLNKALVIGIFILLIGMSVVSSARYNATVYNLSRINSKMDSPTVLLDENFSGTFPPEGWETETYDQYNLTCCDSEPPCTRWNFSFQGPYYITSKAIDANNYEKCIIKFYFGAQWLINSYTTVYLKYRRNETSPWIDITPYKYNLDGVECDYYETEITYDPKGCGEALQINWSCIAYYYAIIYICIDDVKIFGIPINNPPEAPTIDGQLSGKPDKEYEYIFNATDTDGDDVKYYISWGDNNTEWTGFNASGTDVMVKHKWTEDGTYNITAKAEDIHGAQGPEGTLTVTMPKNRAFNLNFNLLNWLFDRFPFLERLLTLIRVI
jgi:hypothetical protein